MATKIDQVFFDLDGVLADFVGGVSLALGFDPGDVAQRVRAGGDFWRVVGVDSRRFLSDAPPEFWANLEPIPAGVQAFMTLRRRGVYTRVLTSPPGNPAGFAGKQMWCEQHLRDARPLMVDEKYLLARPGRLLVDDSEYQVDPWRAAGGTAVLFPRVGNDSDLLGATPEDGKARVLHVVP